ncbi:MAG: hypothetical protein ILP13_04700 [Lachnospiraceae bacterium]|nr:hypothetical protein [Lachnospiraceae bacterium]
MKRQRDKNVSKLPVFLGIIWGVMLVCFTGLYYKITHYDRSPYVGKPSYLASEVIAEQYGGLYERVDNLLRSGMLPEEHPEYAELVALHDYVENCAFYVMYSVNGDEEKKAKYMEALKEARARMGDLEFAADEITHLLCR